MTIDQSSWWEFSLFKPLNTTSSIDLAKLPNLCLFLYVSIVTGDSGVSDSDSLRQSGIACNFEFVNK